MWHRANPDIPCTCEETTMQHSTPSLIPDLTPAPDHRDDDDMTGHQEDEEGARREQEEREERERRIERDAR